jgi:hypothetical protein
MDPYPLHYSRHQRLEDVAEPTVQMMFDEMQRMGARLEGMEARLGEKIEGRCSGLEQHVLESEQHNEERLISLEMARSESETSRVEIDKRVDGLKLEVLCINKFLEQENLQDKLLMLICLVGISTAASKGHMQSLFGQVRADYRRFSSRCSEERIHSFGIRIVRVTLKCMELSSLFGSRWHLCIWKGRLPVGFSRLRVRNVSWEVFYALVHDRFGRDQHEALIRQTGTVPQYVDQFSSLVDQLAAYEAEPNPLYYATRFVDGLRDNIKSIVMIQQPSNLDSECALALVQEEAADSGRKCDFRRFDSAGSRAGPKLLGPGATVSKADKVAGMAVAEDSRNTEASRASNTEDKMRTLKQYRRARGLCDRCAEKWSYGHKCAPTVQLHAIQELWEMFSDEDGQSVLDSAHSDQQEDFSQLSMCLSEAALQGTDSPKSMRLWGKIQGHDILILVDSGSTHTFISTGMSHKMQGQSALPKSMRVKVANGAWVACESQFLNAAWEIQHCRFVSDLRVLQLQHYDMVLGFDWLEKFSPMRLHWAQKWIAIPYESGTVVLHGIQSGMGDQPQSLLSQLSEDDLNLDGDEPSQMVQEVPHEVQLLLDVYVELFVTKVSFPPPRKFSHSIPLISGYRTVNLRQYRYAPALKFEIEHQVQDMLQSGLIQQSNSPFSSPVLLVKKKDNSYRFCVDYRHLNAITVKGQFPVPVIDEFLDELQKASWFSCLDLCSGFHQIPMTPEDCFKTTFQTHMGHYEFRVMSFGLTGALHTFQKAMNATLAPLLRKCVLVFFDDILVYSQSYDEHLQHLEMVFKLLQQEKWSVKRSKCSFARREISYLGYVISEKGVSTSPAKVQAVLEWPTPSNVKEVRSFLGLAGYYRKFVRHFGIIAKPLTNLLKKHALFVWTADHDTAFQTLKTCLVSAPVLA